MASTDTSHDDTKSAPRGRKGRKTADFSILGRDLEPLPPARLAAPDTSGSAAPAEEPVGATHSDHVANAPTEIGITNGRDITLVPAEERSGAENPGSRGTTGPAVEDQAKDEADGYEGEDEAPAAALQSEPEGTALTRRAYGGDELRGRRASGPGRIDTRSTVKVIAELDGELDRCVAFLHAQGRTRVNRTTITTNGLRRELDYIKKKYKIEQFPPLPDPDGDDY